MTILTVMLLIAIAAFILWFGEELLREIFSGEEETVIDLRRDKGSLRSRPAQSSRMAHTVRRYPERGVMPRSVSRTARRPHHPATPVQDAGEGFDTYRAA